MKISKSFKMSALARLMAGENITVTHSPKIHTAMFDLRQRELLLPIWNDMSPELYDLLMAHEISHALNTPIEGWHGAIEANGRNFKGYLNVLEDVRIERLIKDKYPGLTRTFTTAYRELVERDFFGLKKRGINANTLPLIDRINIQSKAGAYFALDFNAVDREYLDQAYATESFEEVRALAEKLFTLDKAAASTKGFDKIKGLQTQIEEMQKALRAMREQGTEGADRSSAEFDEEYDIEAGEDEEDSEAVMRPAKKNPKEAPGEDLPTVDELKDMFSQGPQEQDKEKLEEEHQKNLAERFEDKFSQSDDLRDQLTLEERMKEALKDLDQALSEDDGRCGAGGGGDSLKNEEPTAITDDEFRDHEDSLVEKGGEHLYNENEKIIVLDDVQLSKFVVPAARIHLSLNKHYDDMVTSQGALALPHGMSRDALKTFLRGEQNVINQLVNEFEMRKNANAIARGGSSKTGSINMKRIHLAKFTEDIFQRIVKLPEGKSHGMIMYLDQSGSMQGQYRDTIKQIIVLVEFCRRMSIPFEVYGFSDQEASRKAYLPQAYAHPEKPQPGKVQLSNTAGHLKQYLHSGMGHTEYNNALYNMWRLTWLNYTPHSEALNGTPMNQAILLSGQMVRAFRKQHKVDVVNVLFLTDGEATDTVGVSAGRYSYNTGSCRVLAKEFLSNKFKMDKYNRATTTAAIADLMSKSTGANYIGIYIPSSKGQANEAVRNFHNVRFFGEHIPSKYTFKKDGFQATQNFGFNTFFIIEPLAQTVTLARAMSEVNGKQTANQIAKSFTKAATRLQSRAFLSVFVTQIASVAA